MRLPNVPMRPESQSTRLGSNLYQNKKTGHLLRRVLIIVTMFVFLLYWTFLLYFFNLSLFSSPDLQSVVFNDFWGVLNYKALMFIVLFSCIIISIYMWMVNWFWSKMVLKQRQKKEKDIFFFMIFLKKQKSISKIHFFSNLLFFLNCQKVLNFCFQKIWVREQIILVKKKRFIIWKTLIMQ